jgi:hypothetical protein
MRCGSGMRGCDVGRYTRLMQRGALPLMSVLLIGLLGASPLVGPVCALLCGHPAQTASHRPAEADEHAPQQSVHQHAAHPQSALQHSAHAPRPDRGVAHAPVGEGDSPWMAMSTGVPCCAFDIASSVVAAAGRLHTHAAASQAVASGISPIAAYGATPRSALPTPAPPRPDLSSGRPPLVLRI